MHKKTLKRINNNERYNFDKLATTMIDSMQAKFDKNKSRSGNNGYSLNVLRSNDIKSQKATDIDKIVHRHESTLAK